MSYKETVLFVAKCLTISLELQHKGTIEDQLKNNAIDWEAVVRISTAHYVFPALYCQLKRANFLDYLPVDLVGYMQHITTLNRERNEQIIAQATALNELLITNNITPVFLKGTGNLLEGLYEDIAERMVGDIDFIVSKEEYEKAYDVLIAGQYEMVHLTNFEQPNFKHLSRLKNKNYIAAVEIHKELIIEEYAEEFNYKLISKTIIKQNEFRFLSYKNQLQLSILGFQINDDGIYFNNISLRNAYDVLYLSQKVNSLSTLQGLKKLYHPINNFLSICQFTFDTSKSILFEENSTQKKQLCLFKKQLENPETFHKKNKRMKQVLFIKDRLRVLKKALFRKEYRTWVLKRLTSKTWVNEKLVQLKLKKQKRS